MANLSAIPPGEKRCSRCGEVKPTSAFHRNRAQRDGMQHYCKSCARDYKSRRSVCESCGTEFQGTARTCSWECAKELISRTKRAKAEADVHPIPDDHKLCRNCGEVKPKTDFALHGRSRDGLQSNCKQCHADYSRQHGVGEKPCTVCGVLFRGRAKTCSLACRSELVSRTKNAAVEADAGPIPKDFKLCRKCLKIKPRGDFNQSSRSRDGLQTRCRKCGEGYEKHHGICEVCGEDFFGSGTTCSKACAGVLVSRSKLQAFADARAHIPQGQKQCTGCGEIKPVEDFGKNANARDGLQYKCKGCLDSDLKYRLNSVMRVGIYSSLKGKKSGRAWQSLVAYSVNELKAHLEAQFAEGMTWDNYGDWHIDHIRPVVSFSFESSDDPEFKQCWGLKNLQPLWATDNIRKGATWDPPE